MKTEIFGICGSIFVLFSMLVNTTNVRTVLIMRILNLVASILFVVYGLMLPAYSTIVLNSIVIIVHVYHIVRIISQRKKETEFE